MIVHHHFQVQREYREKEQVSHLLSRVLFISFFFKDYVTDSSGMEHTYCASIATAAVLLSTTLRQKRPMGIQHLDGFHLSGLGMEDGPRGRGDDRREGEKWH